MTPIASIRRGWRRGMTMIEVVLASVLLALLASALMGTVVYANRAEMVRIRRLMAYDVANRILLQYIDERRGNQMPPQNLPVEHEGLTFRYELLEERTEIDAGTGERPWIAEDLKLIRVRVFDTFEPVPGDVQRGELLAELVRPHHLLVTLFRGNDSRNRNMMNPEFLNDIQRIQAFNPQGQPGAGRGRRGTGGNR